MARYVPDRSCDCLFVDGSLDSLLPENSVVRTIWSALCELDFKDFDARYTNDDEGRPALDPRRLAGVWILALARGVTSSVAVERMCRTDVEFRWMAGDSGVKKSTLSAFRTNQLDALGVLSTQVLAALARSDMLPGKELAVDGTVIRAAASCGASCTEKVLVKRIERLEKTIESVLVGPEVDDEKAERLIRRKLRFDRALEEMAGLSQKGKKKRITVTEPEASMKKLKKHGYGPGHNVQVVTDLSSGAIVTVDVVDESNDERQLNKQVDNALEELTRVREHVPEDDCAAVETRSVTADSGYHNTHHLVELEGKIETYVADDRVRNRRPRGVSDAFLAQRFEYDQDSDTMVCPQGRIMKRRKLNKDKTSVTYETPVKICRACKHNFACCPEAKQTGRSVNRPLYGHITDAVAQRVKSPRGKIHRKARHTTMEGAFARIIELLNWRRCRTWGRAGARAEALWRQITHNLMLLTGQWQPIVFKQVLER